MDMGDYRLDLIGFCLHGKKKSQDYWNWKIGSAFAKK
jgi:hypothetical protein